MGIVKWIFNRLLVKKLKNDPEFISAVNDADDAAENLRCSIRKAEKNGVIVPDELKKYAGMRTENGKDIKN